MKIRIQEIHFRDVLYNVFYSKIFAEAQVNRKHARATVVYIQKRENINNETQCNSK